MNDEIKRDIRQILEDELFATGLSTREDWKARVGGKSIVLQRITELMAGQPANKFVSEILNNFRVPENVSIEQIVDRLRDSIGICNEWPRSVDSQWVFEKCKEDRYLTVRGEDVFFNWQQLKIDLQAAFDAQPVDKVQAMAALIYSPITGLYIVPNHIGTQYMVRPNDSGDYECSCYLGNDCDHTQAVEHHLAAAQEVAE